MIENDGKGKANAEGWVRSERGGDRRHRKRIWEREGKGGKVDCEEKGRRK
jgi:hypothetical protein